MTRTYDPTRAPDGRLVRLGVMIDPDDPRAPSTARLCDRAGFDVVWVGVAGHASGPAEAALRPGTEADRAIAEAVTRARVGWLARPQIRSAPRIDELYVSDPADLADAAEWMAEGDRRRSTRVSAAATSSAEIPAILPYVDDVVLPAWSFPDLESAADDARAQAVALGRDPSTLGVAAVVPVSVGRTIAEAAARADTDRRFALLGHPRDIGIFGTLEECQDRVIALAHAGITDLRCILPAAIDIHDVIAQLTAIAVGTTEVLAPGTLRSPAPPPPEGWGGRPDKPPRAQVSDGSRRR